MTDAELQVMTRYSFLRGASAPKDLFLKAVQLGLPALGIADRNSVAGVVRGLKALRGAAPEPLSGALSIIRRKRHALLEQKF